MKNMALNTLTYTGIVTLSQYVGSKKIKLAQVHNAGGASLFSFLAGCLAGDFTLARYNAPTKIKFIERNGSLEEGYSYTSLTQFISFRTPPEPTYNAGESHVKFSFVIPRDFIEKLTVSSSSNGKIVGLGLYANSISEQDHGNFMAFCELTKFENSSLHNAYLVVDWELIISNAGSTTTDK